VELTAAADARIVSGKQVHATDPAARLWWLTVVLERVTIEPKRVAIGGRVEIGAAGKEQGQG
jgi:hypothetical protein